MQAQKAAALLRAVVTRTAPKRNYHVDGPKATYNDLPSPQGSWQTQYDANQRRYNGHLLFGIAFTVGSIVFGKASGLIYLNYSAPAVPAESNDYN